MRSLALPIRVERRDSPIDRRLGALIGDPPTWPSAALGTFDATMLVVGGIIGAGIFINPSRRAAAPSHRRARARGVVAGGAIALAGALAFAELAALFPRTGGEYVYLPEA